MKKLLSLLMATVMATSLFATTALAATTNVTAEFSATEVAVGDTFTLTIKTGEQTIYNEDIRIIFDKYSAFEVVSTLDAQGRDRHRLPWTDEWEETNYVTLEELQLEAGNGFKYDWLAMNPTKFDATTVAVITLKALEAGTFNISVEEYTNYTDATDHTGFDGVAATQQIVVKGAEPEEPEAPVVGETPVVDAENKAKTWTVDIDADYVAAGDTLTAILYDTTNETDTQPVTLSMGNNVVVGGAAWSFTLKATFENAAKMADIGLRVSK